MARKSHDTAMFRVILYRVVSIVILYRVVSLLYCIYCCILLYNRMGMGMGLLDYRIVVLYLLLYIVVCNRIWAVV